MDTFYVGTHQPNWLGKTDMPLVVSVRRLMTLNRLPNARGPWALDSADFTGLETSGTWTIPAKTSVEEVRRFIAFGYKLRGLALAHEHLVSADSLAWSFAARKRPPLFGLSMSGWFLSKFA